MGGDGVAGPPAKKRGATRQISKDDGSDSEDDSYLPSNSDTFQKASEDVIASRRIVKVRRMAPTPEAPAAPNPFATIRLVAPAVSSGLPPVTMTSFAPLAPQETLEGVASKDGVTVPSEGATKNVEHKDELQGGEASKQDSGIETDLKSKLEGENTEPVEGHVQGSTDVAERGIKNGKDPDVVPNLREIDSGDHQTVHVSNDDALGDGVDVKSATVTNTGLGVIANDVEEQHDEDGAESAEVKAPASSVQVNEGSVALPSTNITIKNTVPSLGAAIPGSFSFGTAPLSFETPTAFASFSSAWSAFSSGTASGTSLGSGFAFSKAASEGAFASASSAFGNSNGSSFQLFSTQSSGTIFSDGPPAQPPASAIQFQGGNTQTGEEQEKMVFGGDATLFEFVDASWKERGKGELRVNVPLDKTGKARLLMRSRGNYRLILNASLFPDMKMTSMDTRGVTFACVNSAVEEKSGLVTYAVKFKDSLAAGNFRDAVDANKCPSQGGLKTPENSPSALHGP